ADARGRLEVFDCMRKSVHPAKMLAARELRVAVLRLIEQGFTRLQRDDRVDARVKAFDLIEVRGHHLDARDLFRFDRARKRDRVEIYNIRHAHDFILARSHFCATSHPISAVCLALAPRSAASGPLALPSFARMAIPCEIAAPRKNENATKYIRSGMLARPVRRQYAATNSSSLGMPVAFKSIPWKLSRPS